MARALSVESVIDKNKIASAAVWLACLEIQIVNPNTRAVEETVYVVRNDENIVFNGQVYQAANFDFQIEQKQNEAPSVSLTAQDQNQFIASKLEAMAGGMFSAVILRVVNSDRLDQPPEIEETMSVVGSSVKNYIVSMTLGSENPLGIQFPKHRQFRDRCAWRFKGYGCQYTGPVTTCDYTRDGANGCKQKNNTVNFRGLPGLVKMNI
jgi:phage-related protein